VRLFPVGSKLVTYRLVRSRARFRGLGGVSRISTGHVGDEAFNKQAVALQTRLRVHVGSDTGSRENGTAVPFRDAAVSLLVMTASGQADARRSCRATR
jgi:hypothetical protein